MASFWFRGKIVSLSQYFQVIPEREGMIWNKFFSPTRIKKKVVHVYKKKGGVLWRIFWISKLLFNNSYCNSLAIFFSRCTQIFTNLIQFSDVSCLKTHNTDLSFIFNVFDFLEFSKLWLGRRKSSLIFSRWQQCFINLIQFAYKLFENTWYCLGFSFQFCHIF